MTNSHQFNFANSFFRQLPEGYQHITATPLTNSHLIAYSKCAASLLDLPDDYVHSKEFLQIFSGQKIPQGGHHIAQVYAGHQFGYFVEQLGDGRSIFVGEAVNHQQQRFDIHLKGAGQTPYSRMGDGRAVLRSSIREFLASEAMAALDIPTTRALCLIGSDERVYRESVETGAIMTRLASSHIRFGNFEYFFHKNDKEALNKLADYCIEHHFPDCANQKQPYLQMFKAIVKSTAMLIAKWQAVGFCHGVMNTDNMSIVGLTIDYGPFAFMDDYQPGFICNHSDHGGRYAYEQQPGVGLWNLNALAHSFSNWLSKAQLSEALALYEPILVQHYLELMRDKMGFSRATDDNQVRHLLATFLKLTNHDKVDYTLAFRYLNQVFANDSQNQQCQQFITLFSHTDGITQWLEQYRQALQQQDDCCIKRHQAMDLCNPLYILRNYLAQQAIEQSEQGNHQEITKLHNILTTPFNEQSGCEQYAKAAPDWGKNLEITCSS